MTPPNPPSSATLSPAKTWGYVLINQLAFPGLGTVLAKGRFGYLQAGIMVVGFTLAILFMVYYFVAIYHSIQSQGDIEELRARYRPHLWKLFWGLGLSALAWLWALVSSIAIFRASRPSKGSVAPPPPPVPPPVS